LASAAVPNWAWAITNVESAAHVRAANADLRSIGFLLLFSCLMLCADHGGSAALQARSTPVIYGRPTDVNFAVHRFFVRQEAHHDDVETLNIPLRTASPCIQRQSLPART